MTDTTALWAAVDRLVEPTRVKLDRDSTDAEPWDIGGVLCNVAAYRAATITRGHVPSLWDQGTLGGASDGQRAATPARERSVADWDLLEHRNAIIESVRLFTVEYGDKAKPVGEPFRARTEIRHLASLMIRNEPPDQLRFMVYRVEQWARTMARLLNQLGEPATRRIRVCCANCHSGMILIDNPDPAALYPDDMLRVWPVRITHVRLDDGSVAVRGAECDACGQWWWPDELADAYMEAA